MDNHSRSPHLIPPHGGYCELQSYQMAQAARSGKQNIAEGCIASGTSKKFELKLVGVARASLEELLLDFQDYLRRKGLALWGKDHPEMIWPYCERHQQREVNHDPCERRTDLSVQSFD